MAATPAGPRTPIWNDLEACATRLSTVATRELFDGDSKRYDKFTAEGAGLLLDYTRQRVDEPVMNKLTALADAVGLRNAFRACGAAIRSTPRSIARFCTLRSASRRVRA